MSIPSGLLDAVKNYLDMTWELSEGESSKLIGITERGMDYIDRVAGAAQDYTKETQARALLMEYVRYVRSNAFDEFKTNYLSELLTLQIYQEVAEYASAEESIV